MMENIERLQPLNFSLLSLLFLSSHLVYVLKIDLIFLSSWQRFSVPNNLQLLTYIDEQRQVSLEREFY
jgi:hypothetical protein